MLNTTRWRKLRALHLARHPFCADCAAEGVVTPATEVHHIRPVSIERDPRGWSGWHSMPAIWRDSATPVM